LILSETCVATPSQLRMTVMLLFLMVGNLNLRCFGVLQKYDIIYRDIWSDVWTDEARAQSDRQRVL